MYKLQKCLSRSEFYDRLYMKLMLVQFEEDFQNNLKNKKPTDPEDKDPNKYVRLGIRDKYIVNL